MDLSKDLIVSGASGTPGRFRRPSEMSRWDLAWVVGWWAIGAWAIGPWTAAILGGWALWGVVWAPKQAAKGAK